MSDDTRFEPLGAVARFENALGLPAGFFLKLLSEDDWSFVIKLHALIEAAVSHLLTAKCGTPELLDVFTRIELSNAQTGKIAFAQALGCLDPDERQFVRKLSELRNAFAHDVRNAGTTLDVYVSGLDGNQFRNLRQAIGPGQDPFPIGEPAVPEATFVRENPKLCIWLRALFVIAFAYERAELAVGRADLVKAVLNRPKVSA